MQLNYTATSAQLQKYTAVCQGGAETRDEQDLSFKTVLPIGNFRDVRAPSNLNGK